jgi:hypothetical protein
MTVGQAGLIGNVSDDDALAAQKRLRSFPS